MAWSDVAPESLLARMPYLVRVMVIMSRAALPWSPRGSYSLQCRL